MLIDSAQHIFIRGSLDIYWTMYCLTDIVAAGFDGFDEDLSYRGLTVLTITAHTLVCRAKLQQAVLRPALERTLIYVAVKQTGLSGHWSLSSF